MSRSEVNTLTEQYALDYEQKHCRSEVSTTDSLFFRKPAFIGLTNRVVHPQKIARGLKFCILEKKDCAIYVPHS